jgi:DNA polymerase III delta prime subunit
MNPTDFNNILERQNDILNLKNILNHFQANKYDLSIKRGIYICGPPGIGKTTFVLNTLKEMNYDMIKYDAGDVRNKSLLETITSCNMSHKNIMSSFYNKHNMSIVMDEIDGMNNGDKGGISSLIKIIRPKRTKTQKIEETTMNMIICIGNINVDKKIKELIKVCHVIELKPPTQTIVTKLISALIPNINQNDTTNIVNFIQGDLRKLNIIHKLYNQNNNILDSNIIEKILLMKSYNNDPKNITKNLINNKYSISDHSIIMNETDRTTIGLLLHENIIDVIGKLDKSESIPFYLQFLNNICYADYIDRITFQKQIWKFNEMSSLIKIFKNNKLYHESKEGFSKKIPKYNPVEVRFTKVLTKFATEFNNNTFIQELCNQFCLDIKDVFGYALTLRNTPELYNELLNDENYDITDLDLKRLYRYLDKYTKVNEDVIEQELELSEDL